jgi:hypothetical protein
VLEFSDERLAHSYVLPDAAVAEVARPAHQPPAPAPVSHQGNKQPLGR